VRRHAPLIVALAFHGFVAVMALLFHVRARVSVASAFEEYGTAVPPATAVALSPLFLPLTIGTGLAVALAGLVLPVRRSRRSFLLGAGLCISAFALIFAVVAAFLPIFRPGSL
jgi:hypothetical protein